MNDMMNLHKLIWCYQVDNHNTTIIVRAGLNRWVVVRPEGACDKIEGVNKTDVVKAAMSYGHPILIVEQRGENGYEIPDIDQLFDDETIGY